MKFKSIGQILQHERLYVKFAYYADFYLKKKKKMKSMSCFKIIP